MSDKVVSLTGKPVDINFGETDPAVVEFIEDLLRRAKEGKLLGLVGGFIQENGEASKYTSTFVFCDTGTHNAMLGVVHVAAHLLTVKLLED